MRINTAHPLGDALKKFALLATFAWMFISGQAHAAYNLYIYQNGPNVVASGSGSLTLTGLVGVAVFQLPAQVVALAALAVVGSAPPAYATFTGALGPTSFGPGISRVATSASGNLVGVQGLGGGFVLVPVGYVPGSPLSSSATWAASTIAGLGLNPGTYVYTWASDSFTVRIGVAPPAAPVASTTGVPTLSEWALILVAAILGVLGAMKIRRTHRR